MMEEWHPPLKAALKAYNTEHWSDALPAILLGFRTAYKEDLQSSSAELVYGTIRLPGEFFDSSPMDSSPIQLVENLKSHFDSISSFKPFQEISIRPSSVKGLQPRLH
ncbi:integrase catalytic domain-containing protein [Trichonephila clavata]|uniref:Integrase catalytic domain-containing protein n=1 Tax=Trichonephila clavata TaxID=2740835 RepID=A0A8X6J334_TRICU|nr:integrase catalytic domain-containing protein [Trichonephila clavata]